LFVHATSVQDKMGNKTYNNNTLDREIILIHQKAYIFCSLIIDHSSSAVLDSAVILLTSENYNCKI